jgi:hypothetical protein
MGRSTTIVADVSFPDTMCRSSGNIQCHTTGVPLGSKQPEASRVTMEGWVAGS